MTLLHLILIHGGYYIYVVLIVPIGDLSPSHANIHYYPLPLLGQGPVITYVLMLITTGQLNFHLTCMYYFKVKVCCL